MGGLKYGWWLVGECGVWVMKKEEEENEKEEKK